MKLRKFIGQGKTIIGALSSSTVIFLLAKGYIDASTAVYIGSLTGAILAWGITHKIQKAKK